MGGGSWTTSSFTAYNTSVRNMATSLDGVVVGDYSVQDMFKSRSIDPMLNPKNVMRECCDTEEHPNTIPIILALDVTGSMGSAATEVAKKINVVMTDLYSKMQDVEFLIMGIGDLAYDRAPIQASQFESDIRIAEQLDKIYFESGGGGNSYESYTAAWYFGSRHTKLDCWNRGKKGIIITMGDELINPYLPREALTRVTGDELQANVETVELYKETKEKYDIYHIFVEHGYSSAARRDDSVKSFATFLGKNNVKVSNVNGIADTIVDIITEACNGTPAQTAVNSNGEISW